ncbi:unnamed protein product [Effrenium voratum]|nr:unnamed protein product [Effrenium voratum]
MLKAVDAVELAVRALEQEPSLNAGRGCSLNADGQPELDALLMEGSSRRAGAVAGVAVQHPISLARMVMERTEHVMMAGEGAMAFAREQEICDATDLVTAEALQEWQQWREYSENVSALFAGRSQEASPGDTVGAVALDAEGCLACGTSTGGVVGKRPGRVGDSPLIGCGGYADACGAVSATGHGEAIARVTLSRLALWLMDSHGRCDLAARDALARMRALDEQGGGAGGLLLLSVNGDVSVDFTTQRMAWAVLEGFAGSDGELRSGLEESYASAKRGGVARQNM